MTDTPEDTEAAGTDPVRPTFHGPQIDIVTEMKTAYLDDAMSGVYHGAL